MTIRYCRRGVVLHPGDRCRCCQMHYAEAYVNRSAIPGTMEVEYGPSGPEIEVNLGGGLEYNATTGHLEQQLGGGLEMDLTTGQLEMNVGRFEIDI